MGPQPEARRVPSCLEIFREKYLTAGLLGSANNERVREREVVQSLKIDGGQDVTKVGTEDVELGQQFELPPSNPDVKVQFTCNRHKYSCRTCIETTALRRVCSAKRARALRHLVGLA
jgi:hypothetical protein